VPYSPALSSSGGERLALEAELHQAIRRNELVLHYQPKIDARSRQLVGVEALMRWRRAEGLVAPIDFIPVAEETGLIVALSEWGLFEAARQAARWSQEFGFDRTVAVNLPSRMFTRHDLPDLVLRAAREAGIPHQWLLLEITETGLMKDLQIILPMLHRLSHMGVQISVDDFGTGYSSLHYLTELPISELKIDRSFVVNMAKKPKAIDVIHLIISLARTMNLRVVAEGVEEINQLARLRNMDCDVVQGYLFGRPMPGAALGEWVRQHLAPISRVG
jgi:EAL domain-containing protein (putative c-di-GMP-specific phosphodiesterase class I)